MKRTEEKLSMKHISNLHQNYIFTRHEINERDHRICNVTVPPWAWKPNGCMLTALPSLTVTYLPEQAAVELTSDCGLDGTRRIACKGQAVSV